MFTAGCIAGKLEDIIPTTDVYIKGKTCSSGKGDYMSTIHSQFLYRRIRFTMICATI